jgi:hypothetical protein
LQNTIGLSTAIGRKEFVISASWLPEVPNLFSNGDRCGGILVNHATAENGHLALQMLDVRRRHTVEVVIPDGDVRFTSRTLHRLTISTSEVQVQLSVSRHQITGPMQWKEIHDEADRLKSHVYRAVFNLSLLTHLHHQRV